jgi:uncharacterized protein (TIGR00369 family)
MSDDDAAAEAKRKRSIVTTVVPHNRALDLQYISAKDGDARFMLPYAKHLVGDPRTGVLHGGAITTLIDSACGAAVLTKLGRMTAIATLDLRIDYLKPAPAGKDVTAHTVCYKLTSNVAFVRGVAYCDDEDDPIASAAGSFMVSTRGRSSGQKYDKEGGK